MFKTILFPIDVSEANAGDASIPVLVSQAKAYKAKVILLTVLPDYGMSFASHLFDSGMVKKIVKDTEKKLQDIVTKHMTGIKTEICVVQGTVYEAIIEKSKKVKADLIIMSANRPELKDYLLGPNAARVVRHSDVSVLVVRE
jgi:nucleotide-binding universal stress UspA family protein